MRWFFIGFAASFFLSSPLIQAQQTPTFESVGPTREITEGSRFEVSFSLKNAAGKRFIPPDFNGFQVTGGPSEMRGAGFINGQSYSHQTWTYELEAGKTGTYTIGPAIVQTNNQTLRTQPLTIRVAAPRASRTNVPPKSDDRVFVSGELDREKAWVGQQLHYQIKLYTQVNISDFDILDLPPFEGFFTRESRRFDTRTQYQTIRGKKYATRVLYEMALFPQESGEILISPARVRLGVEQPGSFSALLGSTPVLMQTQPIKVRIQPLPEPSPVGFSGGVGQYTWKVETDKDSLSTDDALTVTVSIQGNGDARRFANPRFPLPDGLECFEPKAREEEEYETGDQFIHARTLEYVILPKRPGDYVFTPEIAVFDPDSGRYKVLKAATPIHLTVSAGKNYGQQITPTDTLAGPAAPVSPFGSVLETATSWLRSAWFLGGTSFIILAFLFFFWRKKRPAAGSAIQDLNAGLPARPNLKESIQRFKKSYQLAQHEDPRVFYHELLKSLQACLEAWLDLEPADLNINLLVEKLRERQVPETTVSTLLRVWQTCEQAVFAGQARAAETSNTWYQAQAVLQQLEIPGIKS